MTESQKSNRSNLFELFVVFLKIGAFTFGGGYAMVPLIQRDLCEKKNWIENEKFLDMLAVAQSLPGPIAVNIAAMTGQYLGGWAGAFAAVMGAILPSIVSIILIAMFIANFATLQITQNIFRAVRPVVVALISISAIRYFKAIDRTPFNLAVEIIALLGLVLLKIKPIYIILSAILFGIAKVFIGGKSSASMD